MKKIEEIKPYYIDENGVFCVNACCDAANDDWIRAGRLARAAKAGDKKAAEELARMEGTPMLREMPED